MVHKCSKLSEVCDGEESRTRLKNLRSESSLLPTFQDECEKVSKTKSGSIFQKDSILPSNDQDIVLSFKIHLIYHIFLFFMKQLKA
jgi:hypothetical protein